MHQLKSTLWALGLLALGASLNMGCSSKPSKADLASLNLLQGELALCGSEKFGTINFALTCKEEVKADFDLAVALLHSFEYEEAEKAFARVINADPQCAIAYWGVAMSNYHPLWAPTPEKDMEKCANTLRLAQSLPTKTAREAAYINAIAQYYTDYSTLDHKTRAKKYLEAMEILYNENPDDKEAAIFYALALNSVVDPKDKTFANQLKAGQILNGILPDQPDHPGIAHYLIHTFDYPELAHLALDASRNYAKIAPSSAHAQHMPSHIFIRLGLWQESINSNLQSADAARCYTENLGKEGHWGNELHALDYLMYGYLQTGQLDQAAELYDYSQGIKKVFPIYLASGYALAAIPARYALELKNWEQAAAMQKTPAEFPWEKFPWEGAITHFARALGKIHTKDLKGAQAELDQLNALRQQLLDQPDEYKAGQVLIQIKTVEAWMAMAQGKNAQAITLMTEAANMEDGTSKHPVTPGEVLPARELLGDMYLKLGKKKEAAKAYQDCLTTHPNRKLSLEGLKKAGGVISPSA